MNTDLHPDAIVLQHGICTSVRAVSTHKVKPMRVCGHACMYVYQHAYTRSTQLAIACMYICIHACVGYLHFVTRGARLLRPCIFAQMRKQVRNHVHMIINLVCLRLCKLCEWAHKVCRSRLKKLGMNRKRLIYIYIHIYIHTYIHMETYLDVYTYMYIYIYTHTHLMHSCTYNTFTYDWLQAGQKIPPGRLEPPSPHLYRWLQLPASMYVCMYTYIHIHSHVYKKGLPVWKHFK